MQANCEIACPGYRRWVKGYYDVDSGGRYLLNEQGKPIPERTYCFNENNTCPHETCLLHRKGKGTVAPSSIKLYPNTFEKVPIKRKSG